MVPKGELDFGVKLNDEQLQEINFIRRERVLI
jgi:hypothetical protein